LVKELKGDNNLVIYSTSARKKKQEYVLTTKIIKEERKIFI
jgi:hypothetical protein